MRSTTKLMKNWQFTGPDGKTTAVDLPHTWNNIDGQFFISLVVLRIAPSCVVFYCTCIVQNC